MYLVGILVCLGQIVCCVCFFFLFCGKISHKEEEHVSWSATAAAVLLLFCGVYFRFFYVAAAVHGRQKRGIVMICDKLVAIFARIGGGEPSFLQIAKRAPAAFFFPAIFFLYFTATRGII